MKNFNCKQLLLLLLPHLCLSVSLLHCLPKTTDQKVTTISYYLYKTMQYALYPNWDPKVVFPEKGLGMINKLALNRRGIAVYRMVKVVASPD